MRIVTAGALTLIGWEAKAAVPALNAMAQDKNPKVRAAAADAFKFVDPKASESDKE